MSIPLFTYEDLDLSDDEQGPRWVALHHHSIAVGGALCINKSISDATATRTCVFHLLRAWQGSPPPKGADYHCAGHAHDSIVCYLHTGHGWDVTVTLCQRHAEKVAPHFTLDELMAFTKVADDLCEKFNVKGVK